MKNSIPELLSKLNQNRIDFLEMTSKANHEKLGEKPDSDAWNALEIMEHVMVSEFGTLGYMKKKCQANAEDIPVATEENKFAASKLNEALISDRKWKAPEVLPVPTGQRSREEMLEFWSGMAKKIDEFVENLDEDYYERQVFKHPYAGRLNLYQTLEFLANHYHHHQHQLRRMGF